MALGRPLRRAASPRSSKRAALRAQSERIGNVAERCGRVRCRRGCACPEAARADAEPYSANSGWDAARISAAPVQRVLTERHPPALRWRTRPSGVAGKPQSSTRRLAITTAGSRAMTGGRDAPALAGRLCAGCGCHAAMSRLRVCLGPVLEDCAAGLGVPSWKCQQQSAGAGKRLIGSARGWASSACEWDWKRCAIDSVNLLAAC